MLAVGVPICGRLGGGPAEKILQPNHAASGTMKAARQRR